MKNVQFLNTNESIEVDLLIILDEEYKNDLDEKLDGMLSYNLERFKYPVTITTNGNYQIPKIIIVKDDTKLHEFAKEKSIAIAIGNRDGAKIAYEMLYNDVFCEELHFLCHQPLECQKRFKNYSNILGGQSLAKKLISSPANLMPPDTFADECKKLEDSGLSVTILDEHQLNEIGADALIAVGKGSANPPKMVIIEWKGSNDDPIVFVGKGICFDSGGIHLKNSHLNEMKWDKAGGGVVAGLMGAVAKANLSKHVIGIIPLAENMPDGNALKPGDVISSLGGKTIEIADTDCEGRLVLADGLAYAQKKFSPRLLIDLGTLTLETFGALGGEYAGLFCNNVQLQEALIQAGNISGEKLWSLPLGKYYADQLYSNIANLKNMGVFRYGGSSAAAEFLRAFVNPEIPWAHLDISGVSWNIQNPEKGVSAFGVHLLFEFLNLYHTFSTKRQSF